MNYIYDILLNFQKDFYDFYEWNNDDEITHIRKIPLFRISSKDFCVLKDSIVRFDKEFTDKIHNRTEKFKKINVATLNYVFLVSDCQSSMAIKLSKNGITTHKSSLLMDEEEEISDMATDLKLSTLDYKVIKQSNKLPFQTRGEQENGLEVINKLSLLYNHKDDEKLKYLYLECFGKDEEDVNKIFSKLRAEINSHNENYLKISDFFKIINQK